MTFTSNQKVLRNKYTLLARNKEFNADQSFEAWIAYNDQTGEYCLIKLWSYLTNEATDLQRALWDAELRSMYRVSSSPGAEYSILLIKDAGLDQANQCFVMVLNSASGGYENLADAVENRKMYTWLSNTTPQSRTELWRGFRQIALGIQMLHIQAMLHRNVSVENVYFHPDLGPSSLRLSGFEWSIRIGEIRPEIPPTMWSTPPEIAKSSFVGFQQEMDWYGFGILLARCLINLEYLNGEPVNQRYAQIIKKIEETQSNYLSDRESQILLRLIDRNAHDRLTRASDILNAIDELLLAFSGAEPNLKQNPLVLTYYPDNLNLIEKVTDAGFRPDSRDPGAFFNPLNRLHVRNLDFFIQQNLSEPYIYLISDRKYILVGENLSLLITRLRRINQTTGNPEYTWDVGFIQDTWGLRNSDGGTEVRELPPNSIVVRSFSGLRVEPSLLSSAQNWERFLPYEDRSATLRSNLANLHDFIRCTNQLELLMRDAELFQYEQIDYSVEDQTETMVIKETPRDRPVLESIEQERGLIEFLQTELESNPGRQEENLVVLTTEDESALRIERENKLKPNECFYVYSINPLKKEVTLRRTATAGLCVPPAKKGWLRTFGMFGQIELIRRRKEAIQRMANHSYLLRSLFSPSWLFIDTGESRLPVPVAKDRVDVAKQAAMQDVLRTRPIYTLQGPPGTGKTTMVAHLLRQIFTDDPVAQVLITAQAHGAVDVLRLKVSEAFTGVDLKKQPLAIRLARPSAKAVEENRHPEGSVEYVAQKILEQSIEQLESCVVLLPIQIEWLEHAKHNRDSIRTSTSKDLTPEFCELVKRGANIVYSTTSASDLEVLARSMQSYDWTIIEEAGKCHGFDLALPLQAGHRWLLIGDQNQLPAYRLGDFKATVNELDAAVGALVKLPNRAGNLLDFEWIQKWNSLDHSQKENFKAFCKNWLRTFEQVYTQCTTAGGEEKVTIERSIGAAAGMLSMQYRMHPTIGTLISQAYYDGRIKNMTVDEEGIPKPHVIAPLNKPGFFEGGRQVGIVWIDTPAAWIDENAKERGPREGLPRYSNPLETKVVKRVLSELALEPNYLEKLKSEPEQYHPLKLAVLSPYNQQIGLLRGTLNGYRFPEGIEPKEALQASLGQRSVDNLKFIHTVDAFQGNEADIIIVSLVRNNQLSEPSKALGFLREKERTNVLLSRAQRLLILVGSWDFFKLQMDGIPDDPSREEWKLKRALSLVEGWFVTGEAIKIPSGELLRESPQED